MTDRKNRQAYPPQTLKCGHPDETANLRWHRDDRRLGGLGGSWRCRTCARLQHADYRATPSGQAMRQAWAQSDIGRAAKAALYEAGRHGRGVWR